MSTAKKTIYAAIGAGTTVLEKAREIPQKVISLSKSDRVIAFDVRDLPSKVQELPSKIGELPGKITALGSSIPERASKLVEESKNFIDLSTGRATGLFTELTERGEAIYKKVQRSAPTRKAAEQNKSAKTKVKAASTSVKKAAEANVDAVKAAAAKVGDATA